jgi:hypothetical protein
MMTAAQQDQVVDPRLAPLGPVLDVMGIDEAAVLAPREATAPVTAP